MTSGSGTRPSFDDLPVIEPLGLRHAWNAFDRDDELATVGDLGPAEVLRGIATVRDGTVWNLTLPLDGIDPPLFGREAVKHTVFRVDRNTWDDRLDNFYLQSSTHWDGLRHIQCREFGLWGGRVDGSKIAAGLGPLGIEHWARHGIVGRAVLLDVAGWLRVQDPDYEALEPRSISSAMLESVINEHGIELCEHDILCVRTGWLERYNALDQAGRATAAQSPRFAGLAADEEMSRWLWDRQITAVATDNPGVELAPGDPEVGSLHRRLIPLLGITLGELFDFEALAAACNRDQRWTFLLVSAPLYLRGGVGSPANALGIR